MWETLVCQKRSSFYFTCLFLILLFSSTYSILKKVITVVRADLYRRRTLETFEFDW